jgi:two-component system, cell cycle sensor histidine kinase and response regulator CckA
LGVVAIATALVTLLVISIYCFQDWKRYENNFTRARGYRYILTLNESLLNRMRDAETGQRGFLLTGQQDYLNPYKAALEHLPAESSELAGLLNQDPDQRARFQDLQTLMAAKLAEMRMTIELRESQQTAAAVARVQTGQGERLMQGIRRVSREIEDTESARRQAAADEIVSGTQRLRSISLGGSAILVALVGFAVVALRRAASESDQLIAALDDSKHSAEQSREMLRATLYSIGDGVITTDRAGSIQMMNPVAERLTGYTETEARGIPVEQTVHIVHSSTRHTVLNPVRQVLAEGKTAGLANHTVLIPKTGAEIAIDDTASPITAPSGAITGVVFVFRDVSARKKADDAAQHLAAIVENSDDAIVGKTLDGIVVTWNRGAERIFGYSAEEMIGLPIARVTPADRLAETQDILRRVGSGELIDHYETERLTKNGCRIAVSLTVSPIRDSDGRVVGASKIARDISHEKQLEEFVRQTQKMEAVGRLAGGLAHDFNNLLTVILGYASSVQNRLAPQDPLRLVVTEILRAGERAASLTGQLLAFSRKQIIQPRVLDLNAFIAQTGAMLERLIGEDIDLALVLDRAPCFVKADSGQLTQILMNLAVNARDAMPTGGKLTIESHAVVREQEDLGQRGVRPSGHFVVIVVSDTGMGMDSDTADHLFEPFFTTKEMGKGTGLGLATVYGIVTQHEGWIDVYSEPMHGATFKIFLPRADSPKAEITTAKPTSTGTRKGTILLVEDQAAIRLLGEDVLQEAGHRVLSAGNGRVALELAKKQEDSIDLLITDVVMPEMSGPELASQLVASRPGLIVLYISGYTDHALLHRGTIEQGTAFLQKPFLPQTLLEKVNELLCQNAVVQTVG